MKKTWIISKKQNGFIDFSSADQHSLLSRFWGTFWGDTSLSLSYPLITFLVKVDYENFWLQFILSSKLVYEASAATKCGICSTSGTNDTKCGSVFELCFPITWESTLWNHDFTENS